MAWWWWIIPGVVGVIGLAIVLSGLGWMFRGRPFKGGRGVLGGGLFLGIAAVVGLLGLNVQTYHRLTYERQVASIEIRQKGPQLFDATVTEPPSEQNPQGVTNTFELHGDEWRIEARVLKWKPWANVLGLDSQYRLDRFSGRYADTQQELTAERSAYDIRPTRSSGLDLWPIAREYSEYLPLVDTLYGSGAYMPMSDGARYEVRITQNGLIARPTNEAAAEASSSGWQ
ncbi:membrane protein [alpha proteobacterium U9-1i]|nr:membrane protein [alpha proteobacterium U9-1i]